MEAPVLMRDKHISFVYRLYTLPPHSLESLMTRHLRINGIYWALIALHLLGRPSVLPKAEVIAEVLACRHPDGGFGSAPGHDPHVVCTLHAIQILTLLDSTHLVDADDVASWISSLQIPSGAITGDKWGEVDNRLNYAATQCLALLDRLPTIDTRALQRYVLGCRNFDGGFGMVTGGESHAAHAFTALGTLSILSRHHGSTIGDLIDVDSTAWWLSLRQVKSGGLNGRPEKLEDVCYSWWVISSLAMLARVGWIDRSKLREFILSSQDAEGGGMSDRPGDVADIYHTCFGIAGLSLLGHDDLVGVDPRYCMPADTIAKLGL